MTSCPDYPLGAPINRPPPPDLMPDPHGRPGWYVRRDNGQPVYIEPPRQGRALGAPFDPQATKPTIREREKPESQLKGPTP